jgi:hypothetical protein
MRVSVVGGLDHRRCPLISTPLVPPHTILDRLQWRIGSALVQHRFDRIGQSRGRLDTRVGRRVSHLRNAAPCSLLVLCLLSCDGGEARAVRSYISEFDGLFRHEVHIAVPFPERFGVLFGEFRDIARFENLVYPLEQEPIYPPSLPPFPTINIVDKSFIKVTSEWPLWRCSSAEEFPDRHWYSAHMEVWSFSGIAPRSS